MSDVLVLKGKYQHGAGLASKVFASATRKALFRRLFGYADFKGTFNVHVATTEHKKLMAFTPSVTGEEKNDLGIVRWKFYLCDIVSPHAVRPAWILEWTGPGKNSGLGRIELMSKELIPESFKGPGLRLRVYRKWSTNEVTEWAKDRYWFQSFPWAPQRSDSKLVWDTIRPHVKWEGARTLDIGAHTGYFSYEAAKCGSIVTLFEPDRKTHEGAVTIGRHIESQDVKYTKVDPGGKWDNILYLSVHHQPDPTYSTLKEKIIELKGRCKHLFLELIVPPLAGVLTGDDVDVIVGRTPLREYRHKVRKVRRIYHVKGEL